MSNLDPRYFLHEEDVSLPMISDYDKYEEYPKYMMERLVRIPEPVVILYREAYRQLMAAIEEIEVKVYE